MNKQELIERLKDFKVPFGDESEYVKIDTAIKLASELDEPQKVTVPQFVADWIEKVKKELSLGEAMSQGYAPHEVDSWLRKMDQDGACLNQEIFARAWLDGYEVEKEPKYTVKVKGNFGQYLGKYYLNNVELTPQFIRVQNSEPSIFTKEELEQTGFGWMFDCPGMEVREVE